METSNQKKHVEMYRLQLQKLLQIPKLQQKTPEWYKARNDLITASDFAQALGAGKFGTQRQLIEKKVEAVLNPVDDSKPLKNMFFEWGNLFEPVACNLYSVMHGGVKVHEFGLLRHPTCSFFGASPDGITEDGVMLEIKCPLKRKISPGDIPLQYYYQIQGQLDVCGLDECDYFECEFAKYNDYDEYSNAYDGISYTGVIVDGSNEEKEYPTLIKNCICPRHENENAVYWVLTNHHIKRVTRDRTFVQEKLAALKEVWDKIVYYRGNPSAYALQLKRKVALDTVALHPKNETSSNKYMIVDLE